MTLDLSEWKANEDWEAWNVKGTFGYTIEAKKIVKFEDNATITVNLGCRKLKSGTQVVLRDDSSKPANLSTLKFRLADGQGGSIVKADNGLRFVRAPPIVSSGDRPRHLRLFSRPPPCIFRANMPYYSRSSERMPS